MTNFQTSFVENLKGYCNRKMQQFNLFACYASFLNDAEITNG